LEEGIIAVASKTLDPMGTQGVSRISPMAVPLSEMPRADRRMIKDRIRGLFGLPGSEKIFAGG